jgi:hypothetical protein
MSEKPEPTLKVKGNDARDVSHDSTLSNSQAPDTKERSLKILDASAPLLVKLPRLSQPLLIPDDEEAIDPPPLPLPLPRLEEEFVRSSTPDSVRKEKTIVKADRTSPHILQLISSIEPNRQLSICTTGS